MFFDQDPPQTGVAGTGLSIEEINRRMEEARQDRVREQFDSAHDQIQQDPATFQTPQQRRAQPQPGDKDERGRLAEFGVRTARGAMKAVDETTSFFTRGRFQFFGEERLPERGRESAGFDFVEGMAQFFTGFIGAGKVIKPLQIGQRVVRGLGRGRMTAKGRRSAAIIAQTEAASVITDVVAFNPYEERVADLVEQMGPRWAQPVGAWLSADEDDPEMWARAKQAIEGSMLGLALGGTIAGTVRLVRLSGIHKRFKSGKITAEEATARAEAVKNEPESYSDAIRIWHGRDGQPFMGLADDADFSSDPLTFIRKLLDEGDIDDHLLDAMEEIGLKGKNVVDLTRELDQIAQQEGHGEMLRHVTVRLGDVREQGLRAHGGEQGEVLGSSFGISTTWDPVVADFYESTFRAAANAARRNFDGPQLREYMEQFKREEGETFMDFLTHGEFEEVARSNIVAGALGKADLIPGSVRFSSDPDMYRDHLARILRGEEGDQAFDVAMGAYMMFDLSVDDSVRFLEGLTTRWPRHAERGGVVDITGMHRAELNLRPGAAEGADLSPGQFWSMVDPEQIGQVQVRARRTIDPEDIFVNPMEREVAFRTGRDLEVVDRMLYQSERQAAAFNMLVKARQASSGAGGARASSAQIKQAVERITKRLDEGLDPHDPMIYSDIGINLGLLTRTFNDFKSWSDAVARAMPEEHTARRFSPEGPRTFEELEQASQAEFERIFGKAPTLEDLRAWSDELGAATVQDAAVKIDAAFKVMHLLATDLSRVARALSIAEGVERVPLQRLLEDMTETFAHIQFRALGSSSDAGRLLNFQKKKGQTVEQMFEARREGAAKLVQEGADASPRKMSSREAHQLARNLWEAEGDPEKIRRAIMFESSLREADAVGRSKMDMVNSFRISMLLSGPKTMMINAINNAITMFQVPVEHFWAGVRFRDKALRDFSRDEFSGIMQSVGEAFEMARVTWRKQQNTLDPVHRVEEGTTDAIGGLKGMVGNVGTTILSLPGRALMTTDEFFKQLGYRGHIRGQIMRQARESAEGRGLNPSSREYREFVTDELATGMKDAFTDIGSARNPFALEHARYITFQNQLGDHTVGGLVKESVNRHPSLRLVMPFVRTPINLFRFAWQRTPYLGRFQHQMREDLAAGGTRAAVAKARLEVGWVVWGSAAMLMMGDRMTGGGPNQPQLRRQWLDAGYQPYSFRFPNGDQLSYRRIEPLMSVFGIVADAVEASTELGEEDMTQVAYAAVAGIMSSTTSKTFLIGLSDILSAMAEGEPRKVKRWMDGMALSFTPSLLNQINHDPVLRDGRTFVDQLKRRLPGFSESVEPRRNLFGEVVMKPAAAFGMEFGGVGDYANRSLNPFTTMKADEDFETFRQLVDLGRALPYPQPTRLEGHIDLRDRKKFDNGTGQSPYDRIFELVSNPNWGAPPLRDALREFVQSSMFQQLGIGSPDAPGLGGGRYEVARRIVQQYYRTAEAQVLQEYPLLMTEMQRLRIRESEGVLNTDPVQRDQQILDQLP
jgi:hypothetical protein